jgi:hypothetical protein
MHRSETRDFATCAECGVEMEPARDRAYGVGPDSFLCFACALRRGGAYDEQRDCWLTPPDTSGLHPEE